MHVCAACQIDELFNPGLGYVPGHRFRVTQEIWWSEKDSNLQGSTPQLLYRQRAFQFASTPESVGGRSLLSPERGNLALTFWLGPSPLSIG